MGDDVIFLTRVSNSGNFFIVSKVRNAHVSFTEQSQMNKKNGYLNNSLSDNAFNILEKNVFQLTSSVRKRWIECKESNYRDPHPFMRIK